MAGKTKPRKKKAAEKKPTPAKKKSAARSLPTEIEVEDRLTLTVAVKELEVAHAREQLVMSQLQQNQETRKRAENQLNQLVSQANAKYNVVPGKDSIEMASGQIKRG